MAVRTINDDAHFQSELSSAGSKLVVTDFTATWCPPCQRIAPLFEQLPMKYPRAVFLKVDIDRCQDLAASQGVSATPTFIFYRNRVKIDILRGSDFQTLETKVSQHASASADENNEDYGQGMAEYYTIKSVKSEDFGGKCLPSVQSSIQTFTSIGPNLPGTSNYFEQRKNYANNEIRFTASEFNLKEDDGFIESD